MDYKTEYETQKHRANAAEKERDEWKARVGHLTEALQWVADQPCQNEDPFRCEDSGEPVKDWCYTCYCRAALADKPPREPALPTIDLGLDD